MLNHSHVQLNDTKSVSGSRFALPLNIFFLRDRLFVVLRVLGLSEAEGKEREIKNTAQKHVPGTEIHLSHLPCLEGFISGP